ncbi:MAG TPA: multiheme c-type cytochrome [Planctomycetaceae bacterium]|jgi:hypothetical protein
MRQWNHFWRNIPWAALVVLAVAPSSVRAQDDKGPAPKYQGMLGCTICHNSAEQPNPVIVPEFCLMNESGVFRTEDKHALAYQLLVAEGSLGQRMAAKLKIKVEDAQQCLRCHAGWSPHDTRKPELELLESGVSCESCHGPSSNWDGPHRNPEFRQKSIEEKMKLGMNDVRDPVRRAQLCYSCHIGNADEGRVVTHEMYAAGHPPLPSIEVETFIAAMPAHSRKFQEKGNFKFRDEYIVASRIGDTAPDAMPRTKGVLVGGIVALSRSLDLYAKQMAPAHGPDFAMFDCQACHHELRLPTWRQTRSRLGKPGRPRLSEWPTVLAEIAVAQVEPDAPLVLHEKLEKLALAMSARPFGSDDVLKLISGNDKPEEGLVAWLDSQAQALVARTLVKKDADRALTDLYHLGAADIYDFHSARQIAWAIRAVETETHLTYPTFPPYVDGLPRAARMIQVLDDIKTWQEWRKTEKQAAIDNAAALLGELNTSLRLNLPAGQKASIADNMAPFLEATGNYDPRSFQKLLQEAARRSGHAAAK